MSFSASFSASAGALAGARTARLLHGTGVSRRAGLGVLGALVTGALAACATGSRGSSSSTRSADGSAGPRPATTTGPGWTRHADLAYAATVGRGHLLDLYLPAGAEGPFPVVVFQAGSAFSSDDTKDTTTELSGTTGAADLATLWAPHGYAVVGLNVRASSQARFPAQVHDTKAAIRYLRAHAAEYRLDTGRFATMGTSSGGWGAVMAGVTAGIPDLEGDLGNAGQSGAVQAVVDLFGPTDFLRMDAHRLEGGQRHDPASSPESRLMGFAIQSDPRATRRADPAAHVTAQAPPIWISHGTKDPLVPYNQSQILFAAYAEAGAPATFTLVEGAGHTDAYLSGTGSSPVVVHRTTGGEITRTTSPQPTFDGIRAFLDESLGR
ncbi:alpha/beta hydrolase [Kineosporia sp. J2-2]|uniref:Alpha/beta hydrolase n=1 Tax=Kineosporia corallincola TaxID=2835133 RepID=A0ABS5TII2_9ACTN|nr:alpha/beta hydrolase [Kineosporia corallincola]MBT0770885.1 alpha/beta hydrolase [Kineosporia corallincola]